MSLFPTLPWGPALGSFQDALWDFQKVRLGSLQAHASKWVALHFRRDTCWTRNGGDSNPGLFSNGNFTQPNYLIRCQKGRNCSVHHLESLMEREEYKSNTQSQHSQCLCRSQPEHLLFALGNQTPNRKQQGAPGGCQTQTWILSQEAALEDCKGSHHGSR